jgi:hypothetical protein
MYGMYFLRSLAISHLSTLPIDNLSSLTALLRALDDLDTLFESIEDAYKASLEHDNIVVWDEKR